jgi:hypothetical protein
VVDPTARRNLLLALNARHDLSRDAICRLALAVDSWGAGTTPAAPPWAEAIGVSLHALDTAIATVAEAGERSSALVGRARGLGLGMVVLGVP